MCFQAKGVQASESAQVGATDNDPYTTPPNHRLIHLDDEEMWIDLEYESVDIPQRIDDEPWGFSVFDGRQLFDRRPPATWPGLTCRGA